MISCIASATFTEFGRYPDCSTELHLVGLQTSWGLSPRGGAQTQKNHFPYNLLTYGGLEYGKIYVVPSTDNIYLFVGEDDYLPETNAKKLLEAFVPASCRATAVETIDGRGDNMEEQLASLKSCQASVQTPPFLDPVKFTWWRAVTFLPGGGGRNGSISESVKAELEKFAVWLAEHPLPSNQKLVITATKLLKTSIFAKTFVKVGQIVEFASGGKSKDRMENALMRLPDLAEAEQLKFEHGAAEAFIAKVGTETRIIVSELAKLRTYLGKERDTVTAADIAEVASVGGDEPELWDLTDAVAQRNPRKLLATLARFEGEKGYGVFISSIVEKFFREAYVYRDALDHGWLTPYGSWAKDLPAEVAADLDAIGIGPNVSRGSWATKKGAKSAANFTLNELRAARFRILQAREKLVSSNADDALVVQELLRIVAPRRR